MKVLVERYSDGGSSILGTMKIDGELACYTLENSKKKIPKGKYKLGYRLWGGFHKRYSKKFGDLHKGMLEVKDVPGREFILIHIGNWASDSKGCILVGDNPNTNIGARGFISDSTKTYKRIYKKISAALEKGEEVTIEISDT